MKGPSFCETCVEPDNQSGASRLIKYNKRSICQDCYSLETHRDYHEFFGSNNLFQGEMQAYLNNRERVLYAYSGGLDSLVTLALLIPECERRGIELTTFTMDHGFKGEQTWENIRATIKYFGIEKNHLNIDHSQLPADTASIISEMGTGFTTEGFFAEAYKKGVLPCGKLCNSLTRRSYSEMIEQAGVKEMITGGDTPKMGEDDRFSIHWNPEPGINIVRGAAGFGLSKDFNAEYVEKNQIPWGNPGCGGYDTDCLIPGAILHNALEGNPEIELERVIREFPILIDYFSERVRWKIIKRETALKQIKTIEISSPSCMREIEELTRT